ncbi:MAG: YkgJ family cysteine cluster protein [Deltaproteobacteria bacterium]|nr:YkgJ family cysteine cluster protein [Deltaproteobacteria bacterium]MBW1938625.1 YkgJ family cysteine cluster protein [Deltaproteobacteria bacterium]MBW2080443.1 YkgJ family cysteine cluster protein [Deltaproteobacteria bacterium]
MFKDLENLFDFADRTVADIQKRYSQEVRCKKGCTDCCHAVFDVSLIEALYIRQQFDSLDRKQRRAALNIAKKALKSWNELVATKADLSLARIRCPLLTDNGECICYKTRPINCRTYGIPTMIGNKSHVCGLSGFEKGKTYPALNLEPLQRRLYELSAALKDEDLGRRRWPVAVVLLGTTE